MISILIVDDEEGIREYLADALEAKDTPSSRQPTASRPWGTWPNTHLGS